MNVEPQITYRSMPSSDALSDFVREHCDKLESLNSRIESCHVRIEMPHRHHHAQTFEAHVEILVPGARIATHGESEPHSVRGDAYAAVAEAFAAARRKLQGHSRRQKRQIKRHSLPGVPT